jgi:hypothetical protein
MNSITFDDLSDYKQGNEHLSFENSKRSLPGSSIIHCKLDKCDYLRRGHEEAMHVKGVEHDESGQGI